jgi:hypothetical protein
VGLLLAVSTGCSEEMRRVCEADLDCPSNQICANERCAATCTSDEDCALSGSTCQPYLDESREESVNVCLSSDTGVSDGECTTNADCRRRLDSGRAECGLNGQCIIPPDRRYGLLLTDETMTDPDNPDHDGGLGADIAAVVLTDGSTDPTEAVAWGRTRLYRPAGGVDETSVVDGSPPTLDPSANNRCVEGPIDEATSPLGGGGGQLLVDFVDDAGRPVDISSGQRVLVIEWGDNCQTDLSPQDNYRVALCVSDSEEFDPETHCRKQLGTASGFGDFVPLK